VSAPGWPATLTDGAVTLRPLRLRDASAWTEVRRRNVEWLKPWEATQPEGASVFGESAAVFTVMTRRLRKDARRGLALPFTILVDDRLAGQLNVAGLVRGSLLSAHIGYWVDQRVAGRGVTPSAVALVTDHCFEVVGLHRIEVNIRPDNLPSRRVVEKLGFRQEAYHHRYLHIDGDWRDHLGYAMTVEDVSSEGGLLARWHRLATV
jgi:[ribosomal protein S5]-alanine N-acetyltransferase